MDDDSRRTGDDRRRGSPPLKLEAEVHDAIQPPHKRRRRVPAEPDSSHSEDTPSVSIRRPKRPATAGAMDATSDLADLLQALVHHLHDEAEQTRIAREELDQAWITLEELERAHIAREEAWRAEVLAAITSIDRDLCRRL